MDENDWKELKKNLDISQDEMNHDELFEAMRLLQDCVVLLDRYYKRVQVPSEQRFHINKRLMNNE